MQKFVVKCNCLNLGFSNLCLSRLCWSLLKVPEIALKMQVGPVAAAWQSVLCSGKQDCIAPVFWKLRNTSHESLQTVLPVVCLKRAEKNWEIPSI